MENLSKAAREVKLAYQKAWRDSNKKKVQASQQRYWEKKAANVTSDPEGEPLTPEAKAKALKQAGRTQREIAKELNLSLGTVNRLLKTD